MRARMKFILIKPPEPDPNEDPNLRELRVMREFMRGATFEPKVLAVPELKKQNTKGH